MRRALRIVAVVLAVGALLTILIAVGSALLVDLTTAPITSATSIDGDNRWTVQLRRGPTAWRIESDRQRGANWTATQATGKPDTPTQGDIVTAWASATPDAQAEWLELWYDPPVGSVVAVHVYENDNPGAINRVTLYPRDTPLDNRGAVVAWEGQATPDLRAIRSINAPTTARVFKVDAKSLTNDTPVRRVRLDIDSPAVSGWNEIDAVGLEDASGQLHWARRARASSSYGNDGMGTASNPPAAAIVPRWADVHDPAETFARGDVHGEHRVVEYHGWPLPALRADVADRPTPVIPLRPVVFGFTIDTLLFAATFGLIAFLLRWPARFVVESNRLRRGCCLRCGYDLQYNLVAGCPECGWRRQA